MLPTAVSQGSHAREAESAAGTGFLVMESAVGGVDRKGHVVFVQDLDPQRWLCATLLHSLCETLALSAVFLLGWPFGFKFSCKVY